MNGVYLLRLTSGQRNALIDLISEHLRCPKENQTEEFGDGYEKTKASDLLRIINAARWEREE